MNQKIENSAKMRQRKNRHQKLDLASVHQDGEFSSIPKLINGKNLLPALLIFVNATQMFVASTLAQSIGYHTNLNLGFNPYLSPVFGYGIGLPYGSMGWSPLKSPLVPGALFGQDYGASSNLLSKIHAKTLLKKMALPYNPYYQSFKNKVTLFKHPEYAYTPYGSDYGYGKHYGSAVIPNNPYKSVYVDYYNGIPSTTDAQAPTPTTLDPLSQGYHEPADYATASNIHAVAKYYKVVKPLIKVGALLTTAALLGKKSIESPLKLNPSGMIVDSRFP